MRPNLPLVALLVGCSAAPSQDLFGGGSLTLTLPEDGLLRGTHALDGASQDCLDRSGRDFCTEPKLELAASTEGSSELDYLVVSAWLPVAPEDHDLPCLEGADVWLSVFVTQYLDEDTYDFWIHLEDPALSEADPNADQGGAVSPQLYARAQGSPALSPTASGSVSHELTMDGERDCEDLGGETLMAELSWDFDPSVTAGPGDNAPE